MIDLLVCPASLARMHNGRAQDPIHVNSAYARDKMNLVPRKLGRAARQAGQRVHDLKHLDGVLLVRDQPAQAAARPQRLNPPPTTWA
ncbi:MAG: hypothetical protein ACRED4_05220 [Brevundimonas sp.]